MTSKRHLECGAPVGKHVLRTSGNENQLSSKAHGLIQV